MNDEGALPVILKFATVHGRVEEINIVFLRKSKQIITEKVAAKSADENGQANIK